MLIYTHPTLFRRLYSVHNVGSTSFQRQNNATCVIRYAQALESPLYRIFLFTQASEVYSALGYLNNYVLRKDSNDLAKRSVTSQLQQWEDSIAQKETPTLHRLGMVKGVLATCGSLNIHCAGELQLATETSAMKSALKKTVKYLERSNDTLVSLTCARLLGELFLANTSSSRFSSQLPPSYSYIGGVSKLAAFFEFFLSDEGDSDGTTVASSNGHQAILEVFVDTGCPKLPPVSWATLLNKIFLQHSNNDTRSCGDSSSSLKLACVTFALAFSDSCVDLLLWISSLLQSSVFGCLQRDIQTLIFRSAPRILHALSNSKQKVFLEDLPLVALKTRPDVVNNKR